MAAADRARAATPADAERIAAIYNEGIEDRVATFETELRTVETVRSWFAQAYPIVVVERADEVIAWANASAYRPRACYAGICEFSVYVAREYRGQHVGEIAMRALIQAARDAGYTKLLSRVFVENSGSRRLLERLGFREVGIYYRHGELDGVWRDVVIVEYLLDSLFESWQSLRVGSEILIRKVDAGGMKPAWEYSGVVAPCSLPGWYAVKAPWTMADTSFEGIRFEQGAYLMEYFAPDQPYNVFRVHGRNGEVTGWYANVTAPATLEVAPGARPVLTWEDRWVDVVKSSDGRITTLDEDEIPVSGISEALRQEILQATKELIAALSGSKFD